MPYREKGDLLAENTPIWRRCRRRPVKGQCGRNRARHASSQVASHSGAAGAGAAQSVY